MSSISLFAGLVAIFTAWYFSSFPRNYFLARQTGLPIFLCPVNPANPFWLVFSTALQPTFAHYLPHSVYGDRIKVAIYGWQSRCRYTVHARLGPVFVLVTPGRNEVWIADPEMAHEVLTRRKDFLQLELSSRMLFLSSLPANVDQRHKLILQAGIMSLYGPNLLSVHFLLLHRSFSKM